MNRQSFRKKYRRIRALSSRTVKELVRDPLSWIFALAFPLVMLALFTVINSKIPPEAGMTQFAPVSVGPGILVFAQSFLILFVSLLVSGDRDSALLTRLQVTPAAPSEFHLGYTLPAVLLGLVQGLLTMAAVWVLSLSGGEALSFMGCLAAVFFTIPAMLFCIGLGMLLGTLLSAKAAPGISSAILSAASFLGGCWMDVALLGDGFETVCTLLPWYPAVRMGRAVLGSGTWHLQDLAVTVLWAVLVHLMAYAVRKKRFC